MSGPEHYREAERFLEYQKQPAAIPGYGPVIVAKPDQYAIAIAQVHATLALAAATALIDDSGMPNNDWVAWQDAAGTRGSMA